MTPASPAAQETALLLQNPVSMNGANGTRGTMADYAIYGKIILDDIRLRDGELVHAVLGGGGPQAAFGARLWSDSVGLLTRSGADLAAEHVAALHALDVDLSGWRQYPDIPTPRTFLQYDADESLGAGLLTSHEDWTRLLSQELPLPAALTRPRAIHLITEFAHEPMVQTALSLRAQGTKVSLEPLPTSSAGTDWKQMLALVGQAAIVTPDWPTASRIAESDDPARILRHWSTLGPGIELIAVRHGARGSYVWSRTADAAWHIPIVPVDVVDPTGAGNAYGGGLCVGWTESGDARIAGSSAAISASLLLRQVGLPPMSDALQTLARSQLTAAVAAARRL